MPRDWQYPPEHDGGGSRLRGRTRRIATSHRLFAEVISGVTQTTLPFHDKEETWDWIRSRRSQRDFHHISDFKKLTNFWFCFEKSLLGIPSTPKKNKIKYKKFKACPGPLTFKHASTNTRYRYRYISISIGIYIGLTLEALRSWEVCYSWEPPLTSKQYQWYSPAGVFQN